MRRSSSAAVAMTMAFILAAGACGSGGGGSASGSSSSTSSTATSTAPGGYTTTTTASGGGRLLDADCRFLLAGAFLNPLAAAVPGTKVDFDATARQLAAVRAAAPTEIKDALSTISDAFAALADDLKGVDLTNPQSFADPAVQAKLTELGTTFNAADYTAATKTLSDYIAANCGQ